MTFEVKKWSEDRKPAPPDTGSEEELLRDIEVALDKAEAERHDDVPRVSADDVQTPRGTAAPPPVLEKAHIEVLQPERKVPHARDMTPGEAILAKRTRRIADASDLHPGTPEMKKRAGNAPDASDFKVTADDVQTPSHRMPDASDLKLRADEIQKQQGHAPDVADMRMEADEINRPAERSMDMRGLRVGAPEVVRPAPGTMDTTGLEAGTPEVHAPERRVADASDLAPDEPEIATRRARAPDASDMRIDDVHVAVPRVRKPDASDMKSGDVEVQERATRVPPPREPVEEPEIVQHHSQGPRVADLAPGEHEVVERERHSRPMPRHDGPLEVVPAGHRPSHELEDAPRFLRTLADAAMEVREDKREAEPTPVEEAEEAPDVRIDSDSVWVPRHLRKHGWTEATDHGPPRKGTQVDIPDDD